VKTTIRVTIEIDIARPPADVWQVLTNAERLPEWLSEFESAHEETEGPSGVGSIVSCVMSPGHRAATFEIVQWDPPHTMAWDGPPLRWAGGAARPRGSYNLSQLGDGTTRLLTRFEPELSGTQVLLRPYLSRWLRRTRTADMQTLKSLVEAAP
jgi:uncharacterized protein YndB with AHSA1/START domain